MQNDNDVVAVVDLCHSARPCMVTQNLEYCRSFSDTEEESDHCIALKEYKTFLWISQCHEAGKCIIHCVNMNRAYYHIYAALDIACTAQ
jgi:hypothetical protein